MDHTKIIKEYIKNYPNAYKLTLAKMIVADHPGVFTSVDNVRTLIRWYYGQIGDKSRRTKHKFAPPEQSDAFAKITPDDDKPPQITHIKQGKAFIIGDVHGHKQSPYIKQYFEHAADCDVIILNGDIMDNEDLSRWPPMKRVKPWDEEIELMREFFYDLRDLYPDKRIIYKKGNHEDWYDRELWKSNIAKGLQHYRLEHLLELEPLRIEVIGSRDLTRLGKLIVAHGHEAKRGGKFIANAMLSYYMCDVAFNHFHRVDYAEFRDFTGRLVRSHALPCARNLNAGYTGINNNWAAGFGLVEFTESDYNIDTYIEHDGKLRRK